MQQASSSFTQATPLSMSSIQQHQAQDNPIMSPVADPGFNPASYTRTMLASAVSWITGSSFGAGLYPGTSPHQLLDRFDASVDRLSSFIESDRDVFMQIQNEFCRDFTCCGLLLSDLHALVEHFDEAHAVTAEPPPHNQQSLSPENSPYNAAHHDSPYPALNQAPRPESFDLSGGIELDSQSPQSSSATGSSSHTPSLPPYESAVYSTPSFRGSSAYPRPVSAVDVPTVFDADAHSANASYSTFPCVDNSRYRHVDAVDPAMLFGRHDAHQNKQGPRASKAAVQKSSPVDSASPILKVAPETEQGSSTLSRLLFKQFRCPKPSCNKSYKQPHGLRYHMMHGSCSFAPPKNLVAIQALLVEKGVGFEADLTESDAREVEREVERRLRPFACAVGECARRYKNMNGLRYHYQHSAEHGAEGLRLLASGQHKGSRDRSRRTAQAQRATRTADDTRRLPGALHPDPSPPTPIVKQQLQQ